MRFDWDARKSDQNLAERGFDLAFATRIFHGRSLESEDTRRDYGERRVVAIGMAQDIALTVICTDPVERNGEVVRRIISARVSHRHEREPYKNAISPKSSPGSRTGPPAAAPADERTRDRSDLSQGTRGSAIGFLG